MYSDQRTCAVRLSTITQFFSGSQNSVLKHGVFKNVVPHKLYSYFCQILPTFCKQRQTIRCGQALRVMPKAYASCDEKGDWWHLMYFTREGSKQWRGKSLISGQVRSWVFFPGGLVVRLARHSALHLLCVALYSECLYAWMFPSDCKNMTALQ